MLRMTSVLLASWVVLSAAAAAQIDDGQGREWRQPSETKGFTWQEIASVCPQDGLSPCTGVLGTRVLDRWIWATQDQVIDLFNRYLPENPALPNLGRLSLAHPTVSGMGYFGIAGAFPFAPTFSFTMNGAPYTSSTSVTGWAATLDSAGNGILPSVGFGNSPISFSGSFSVAGSADPTVRPNAAGIWLWRPIGPDYTPPVISPQPSGEVGYDDWFLSDVDLTWFVDEPDSVLTALEGCDPVTVDFDTPGELFECTAASEGGEAGASVWIKRDATPPTLTCSLEVFDLGEGQAQVTASVTDDTSGPWVPTVVTYVDTATTGIFEAILTASDRAGNESSATCLYAVRVPECHGRTPTLLGTGGHDTIQGTEADDVIHGLAGNDAIYGLGGKDIICGGPGNDEIEGGDGDDDLDGGAGFDSIRGDGGKDNCVSGEDRMSSCNSYNEYEHVPSGCGRGSEVVVALVPLAWIRRRWQRRNGTRSQR